MRLRDVAHQREPQSASFGVVYQRIAHTIKLLENLGLFVRRNADSVIDNLKIHAAIFSIKADAQVLVCVRIFHRVIHQVQERTRNGLAVHLQRRQVVLDLFFKMKSVLLDLKAVGFQRASHQVCYVGFAEGIFLLPCLDTREIENIVDQPGQPFALFADDLVVLMLLGWASNPPQLERLSVEANER